MSRTASPKYLQQALDIARRVQYGALATVSAEGQPWCSPLMVVHDNLFRWYWFSDCAAQHSLNLEASPQVALTIYDSAAPEGQGYGVYLLGMAYVLEDPQRIMTVRQILRGTPGDPRRYLGRSVRRVYCLEPTVAWTNAVERRNGRFVRDRRISLSVAALQQQLS